MEEIDRIEDMKSEGLLTDSLYKKLIVPLKEKLAMLEAIVIQDVSPDETGAYAIS